MRALIVLGVLAAACLSAGTATATEVTYQIKNCGSDGIDVKPYNGNDYIKAATYKGMYIDKLGRGQSWSFSCDDQGRHGCQLTVRDINGIFRYHEDRRDSCYLGPHVEFLALYGACTCSP